jgi:hypothetical protein
VKPESKFTVQSYGGNDYRQNMAFGKMNAYLPHGGIFGSLRKDRRCITVPKLGHCEIVQRSGHEEV